MCLVQKLWVPQNRKTTLCVDSYDGGILQGRLCGADHTVECFENLIQFLIKMDTMLEEKQAPQAYTTARTFLPVLVPLESGAGAHIANKGKLATFELQILFRQHTSWQGIVIWKEKKLEQNFRSVLELVFLLDSALRGIQAREVV